MKMNKELVEQASCLYLFSGASWRRSSVLPASRRQVGRSRIVSFCRQDAGSTLNKYSCLLWVESVEGVMR